MAATHSTFPVLLPSISLAALLERDEAAVEAVSKACEEHGVFHLDLRGVNGMTDDWAALLSLAKRYFAQPLEVKHQDDRHSDTWGYEGVGTSAGVGVDHVDGYESFKVSRLELHTGQYHTTFTKTYNTLFRGFMSRVDRALREILSILSDRSERDTGLRIEDIHIEDKISRSTLALFRYLQQQDTEVGSGHNKHTDLGTLTFLLCQQFGLQVLCSEAGGDVWRYLEPKAGHAIIINVGDALRFLSKLRYKSAVHRVIPINGGFYAGRRKEA